MVAEVKEAQLSTAHEADQVKGRASRSVQLVLLHSSHISYPNPCLHRLMSSSAEYSAFMAYCASIKTPLATFPPKFTEEFNFVLQRITAGDFRSPTIYSPECDGAHSVQSSTAYCDLILDVAKAGPLSGGKNLVLGVQGQVHQVAAERRLSALCSAANAWKREVSRDPGGANPRFMKKAVAIVGVPLNTTIMSQLPIIPPKPTAPHTSWMAERNDGGIQPTLTVVPAGCSTPCHYDDATGPFTVWHLQGHKLWLVWDDTDENLENLMWGGEPANGGLQSIAWAFKHLNGLKVSCICY